MASSVPNQAPVLVTADATLTPSGNVIYAITKVTSPVTVCAIILSAPVQDGQLVKFYDEVGHAHTITCALGFMGGAKSLLTFGTTIGDGVELVSRNGYWWPFLLSGVTVTS